jgi:hypothetical protein
MWTRLTTALLAVGATLAAATPAAGGAVVTRAAPAAAVTWAMSQVGTRERGTTNCSAKINRWERNMGLRVPPCRVWCGAFVHEAYLQAGVRLSARLIDPDRSCARRTSRSRAGARVTARWIRSRATRATPCAWSVAGCATPSWRRASSDSQTARARRKGGRFAGRSGHTCASRLSAIDAAISVGAQPIGGPM